MRRRTETAGQGLLVARATLRPDTMLSGTVA